MRVLLVAYALSPSRGSEPAIGWGWASGLAQRHDVTVISRTGNRAEVESYLSEHPEISLRTKWVDTKRFRGPMGENRSYLRWLRDVRHLCRSMVAEGRFDLIHLVSYGSISAPVDLWDLGVPFVWGPLGGGQRLNPTFQSVLGPMPLTARLRNMRIALLPYLPSIKRAARNAALVLATNQETALIVRKCGGKVALFSDTGIRDRVIVDKPLPKSPHSGLRMLWTGRMLYRKGVPLILRAMRLAGQADITLDLVGTGPMESAWRKVVSELDLKSQVTFHGQVPFAQISDFYDKADLFVFSSVNDSFGSQLLEAASRGLPILTLNHQGSDILLPDEVAWKVPINSASTVVMGMAEAMVSLSKSPDRLSVMATAAVRYAKSESWQHRVQRMSELYLSVVS